jgi:hypothetical protein
MADLNRGNDTVGGSPFGLLWATRMDAEMRWVSTHGTPSNPCRLLATRGGGSVMRRVKFSIDERGPFDGAIRRGNLAEGEIEFTAIPVRATEFTSARTIRIVPEEGPEIQASVVRITTDGGYREEADDTMTGYVAFKIG